MWKPRFVLALLVVVSLALVVHTYSTFSHTWDEPCHMAAGLELLDLGTYYYEDQHPPLARVATALGPYLDGHRSARDSIPVMSSFWDRQLQCFDEGRRILYRAGPYDRVLTLARLGILPFMLIALLATFAWARRLLGEWPAVLAAFLVATAPPLLGNAGLATLDVPVAALGVASMLALSRWLDRPGPGTAAALGALTGGAIMVKFSAIPFLGLTFVVLAAWRACIQRSAPLSLPHLRTGTIAIATMLLVFWLSYGVGLTSLADPANRPYESVQRVFGHDTALTGLVSDTIEIRFVPNFIPEIWAGINDVRYHNRVGHLSFLLGEVGTKGWWHFYLVGLAVKTPLPLLLVGLVGVGLMLAASVQSRDWRLAAPGLAFLSILAFVSGFSSINLGVRHILILYPLLAIAAAYVVTRLVGALGRTVPATAMVAALVAWQAGSTVLAHPDHMSYFNILAGAEPERILVSADLDWGQDLRRLEQEVRRRGIDRLAVAYYGSASLTRHDLPGLTLLPPSTPQTGWIAVSLWKLRRNEDYSWLLKYEPVTRVGTSINLYFIANLAAGTRAPVVNRRFHADRSAGALVFAEQGAEVVAAAAGRNDFEVWARRTLEVKARRRRVWDPHSRGCCA